MSAWTISKLDLDAFLTVAYRWTQRGDVAAMPPEVAIVLEVDDSNADLKGTLLWEANHETADFDGPRRLCDPELLAELEAAGDLQDLPDYHFEALPGTPRPETALQLADYYAYQTAGEYWPYPEDWEDPTVPPFELRFTQAMRWHAARLLGLRDDNDAFAYPYSLDHTGIHHDAAYKASGWGLGPDDRDLFLRTT